MVHSDLAENKAAALTDAGSYTKEYTFKRELDTDAFSTLSPAQDGDRDTCKCNCHGKDIHGSDILSESDPGSDGCRSRSQGHEQLTITGTDMDIALEQAPVSKEEAHKAGQGHPQPSLAVRIDWIWASGKDKQKDCGKNRGKTKSPDIQAYDAKTLCSDLGCKGSYGPHASHDKRYYFSCIAHLGMYLSICPFLCGKLHHSEPIHLAEEYCQNHDIPYSADYLPQDRHSSHLCRDKSLHREEYKG